MLETTDGEPITEEMAQDVALLVSLCIHEQIPELMSLPIMGFQYTWSRTMTAALVAYCGWQISVARRKSVLERDPWSRYVDTLNILKEELEGGYKSKALNEKRKRQLAKRVEDMERIKGLPRIDQFKIGMLCCSWRHFGHCCC